MEAVPVVIGTLGVVSKRLDAGLEKLGVTNQNGAVAGKSLVRHS